MWNIFSEDITYLTIQEIKDSSSNTELTSSTNEDIQWWIRRAEKIIDSLIESYGTKVDSSQNTIFPTIADGIPIEVKQATILLTECVFQNRNKIEQERIIKSETRRGNSVTYEDKVDKFKQMHSCMSEEIYELLKKYISSNTSSIWNWFYRT